MSHQNPGSTRSKRRHVDLDDIDQSEQLSRGLDSWSRFIVIEAANKQPIKLNPFAISKAVLGICGEVNNVTRLRSGSLLVECTRRQQSLNLLSVTTFANIEVAVSVHKTLNSCRGIVRDRARCLSDMSEQEITDELTTQGVTAVKRFTMKSRDGDIIPSNTYLLTFALSALPKSIKAGYLNIGVEVYVPNPLRCFKCQKFGHGSKFCNHSVVCQRCGEGHDNTDCTAEVKCANCKGTHLASSKLCPEWQKQTKILKLKHENNISFYEAKKLIENQSPQTPLTRTYSAAVAIATPANPTKTSISIQTDLTWITSDQPVNISSVVTSHTSSTQTVGPSEPLTAEAGVESVAKDPEAVEPATIESAVVTLTRKERKKLNRKQTPLKSSSSEVFLNNPFDALDMDVTPSPETRRGSSSSHSRERSPIEPP
ncbi:uncharacterized protein LOC125372628 [Haliotis rufescens]|uniref:uncharacterized protein LOC125372628 n=1 Tax=Haliotis rufescens TaxID=6454 RepID=UPI00201F8A0B|nr:uncharacterized protein LOC125372628 [Haliotis rufescens]